MVNYNYKFFIELINSFISNEPVKPKYDVEWDEIIRLAKINNLLFQLLEKIFKKLNIKIDVNPVSSDEYNSVAKRPKNSRLSKEKLIKSGFEKLPTWQDAIERYLEELSYL